MGRELQFPKNGNLERPGLMLPEHMRGRERSSSSQEPTREQKLAAVTLEVSGKAWEKTAFIGGIGAQILLQMVEQDYKAFRKDPSGTMDLAIEFAELWDSHLTDYRQGRMLKGMDELRAKYPTLDFPSVESLKGSVLDSIIPPPEV